MRDSCATFFADVCPGEGGWGAQDDVGQESHVLRTSLSGSVAEFILAVFTAVLIAIPSIETVFITRIILGFTYMLNRAE